MAFGFKKNEDSPTTAEQALQEQVRWGQSATDDSDYLTSEHRFLTPGWYPLEVTAGGDGIPTEERYWDGHGWGEVREVTPERRAEYQAQEEISRHNRKTWGDERLGDDPNWDPATSDTDGDGVPDGVELDEATRELENKRRFL